MKKQVFSVIGVLLGLVGGAVAWHAINHHAEPKNAAPQKQKIVSPIVQTASATTNPASGQASMAALQASQVTPTAQAAQAEKTAQATQTSGDCFKEAFNKTMSSTNWRVLACEHDVTYGEQGGGMEYKVEYREGKGKPVQVVIQYHGDPSWIVGDDYRVISPKTIMIGLPAERGGIAYLVHRSNDKYGFSADKIHYETDDEGGLSAEESNNIVHLKTRSNDIVFTIDEKGNLHKTKDHGGTMTCENEESLAGGAEESAKLVVEKAQGKIVSVAYSGSSFSGEEGKGGSCAFSVSRSDSDASFKEKGNRTTVSFKELDHASEVVIDEHKSDDTFTATINASYTDCGAYAAFPRKMVLHADRSCEVLP